MGLDLPSDDSDFELVDSLDVAKQIAAEEQPDLTKINAWLSPTDYAAFSSEFHRHLSSRAPETGEWIRETPQFSLWDSSTNHGSIWIKAVPGAGKSVVAASMVDSLSQNKSVPVMYFFFRQIIETNRSSSSLLRDWLAQLLPFSEILQVSLWELVKEEEEDLESLSTSQLWNYLLAGLRSVEKAYCVVDALDEMSIDEDFLSRLNTLGSFRPAKVKILMTSRPKQYLQRLLKDLQVIHVSLEEELVTRDISLFVRQRTAEFSRDGISPKIRELIGDTVCKRSDGLFLYARLMLDQIAKAIKEKDGEDTILEVVAKLPVGLEEMYNRILNDHALCTQVDQNIQILILQLVTHSARPMRLIEIAKAIETNYHIAATDRDSKEIVRSACGPLLDIMEDEVVQILHHSFTEFLLDRSRIQRSTPGTLQFPVIGPAAAHRSIALACLARLQRDTFKAYPEEDNLKSGEGAPWNRHQQVTRFDFQSTFLRHAFAEYAAKKWPYHAKNYDMEDKSFFNSLETFCDPRSSHFRAWLELMAGETNFAVARKNSSRLHISAGFGLSSWAQHLILSGADANASDSSENTPLFWAAKGGHSEVVRLLLEAGAKPDVDGYDGLKPLHVAASRNHAQVVKLLLAAGVSPTTGKTKDIGRHCGNAPSHVGETPLMYASQSGHVESVLQMIPYAKKEDLENAFCRAAAGGHFSLMSALLETSEISPNATSTVKPSSMNSSTGPEPALALAAQSLEPECVKLLLEKGARVKQEEPTEEVKNPRSFRKKFFWNSQPHGRTAIHSLVQANIGDTKKVSNMRHILEMLLSAGADLEAKDSGGNTPLLLTVGHGWKAPVALEPLLSLGADPSATDSNGETLLHRACKSMANTEVASQLLSHKAPPGQARSSDGVTPLHLAVENIHSPVDHIQLLVDHGADINARDFSGNTPLQSACKGHSMVKQQILSALLRLGANVDVQNSLGQTPMHELKISSSRVNGEKDSDQVRLLIDSGANLEINDHDGMTVLLYAVAQSNRALVDVLLQHPKTPSLGARTFLKGKTVLHLACQTKSPVELVKLLVSKGADPRLTDNDGNTLLHEVAKRFEAFPEEITLVEYLIKIGVSPHARNSQRQTAAHIISPVYAEDNISRTTPTRESFVSVLLRLDPTVDINAQDIDGYTPLHFASAASEMAAFHLIRNNANLNAKSFGLRTPLHCAARGRQSSIIAMLVLLGKKSDNSIDVSAVDIEGRTPLHDACRSGLPESVSILISAGADINLKSKDGVTPLMACAESAEEEKIWFLIRKQSTVQKLTSSCSIQDPFRRLPTFEPRSFMGRRILHDHVARVDVIVKMLIKAKADINGALSFALSCKNTELVAAIRQQGNESPLQKTRSAETSLMVQVPNPTAVIDDGYNPAKQPIASIEDMDEAAMEGLLSKNVDFMQEYRHDDDGTAISRIARLGRTDLMAKIITKAKLLDDPTFAQSLAEKVHNGYRIIGPLLQVACDRSAWNMDMVKLLLTEGLVDVNAHRLVKKAKKPGEAEAIVLGSTALHVLAKGHFWWQVDAIEFLINKGARMDVLDENGQTPLQVASSHTMYCSATRKGLFKPQCAEMLLRLGADPNTIDGEGLTPLNKAGPDGDIIRILLKYGADVSAGRKGVLTSAIESGNVQILKIYLEHGADCNGLDTSLALRNSNFRRSQGMQNRYPLTIAALQPSIGSWSSSTAKEMVKLLLDYGAKVDVPVNDNELLLHWVFQRAISSVLRPFLEKPDLDFNMRDSQGRTVFMAACASTVDSEASFKGFLPAEEKERLKSEYIPAHMLLADSQRYRSTIDYLATDNKGRHLIFYLLGKKNNKVLDRFLPIPVVKELIRQKNNEGFSPLHLALQSGKIELCLKFINEGNADLLDPDPNGDTVLHHLGRTFPSLYSPNNEVLEERLSLMRHALALGVDINSRNKLGQTPLLAHINAGYSISEPSFFLDNGADVRAVANDGTTALHMVARRPKPFRWNYHMDEVDRDIEAFQRLVQLGCDPLQEDGEGRTALDIAASVGNDGILGLYQRKKGVVE